MDVGIGLPSTVPGTTGAQLTEWARRAESRGFSSLGTIDRIVYPNLDPLVALSAAAAVTERIRLASTILIAPCRVNGALLAKQAGSIQRVSGGRMVLGIAPGGREDDFAASGVDFGSRGRRFDEMLTRIRETWTQSGSAGAVGPDVSDDPPQLVIGGAVDAAFRRAAEHGDGWIMGGGTPEMFTEGRAQLESAWSEAGRDGEPRRMALAYFSLGEDAERNARAYLGDYYAWLGEFADQIIAGAAKDEETARGYVQAFGDAGCDELVIFPCSPDPGQVDLLAGAVFES